MLLMMATTETAGGPIFIFSETPAHRIHGKEKEMDTFRVEKIK